MEKKIIELVKEVTHISESELDRNVNIFNSDIVSSLSLLELVSKIEKAYNIVILPEELIPNNFETIGSIIDFVQKKVA
ncbi:phosphopantetheine-binding protein [Clostridium felsineum]|uniref:Uncharacterized protein n=1 Tax=Clostridium felsineum TaxID=36839 RepID=A0A1S8L2B5_9CLOT|nr:phosphopantetheine-binding protein [Clostridium felsineum]MCR3757612.1 hypothetical protein [Clostridium felsineum]URZ03209.1 hypothetical protein CLAUR_032550 [Clostridium felsineum]URZ08451.1 hypothetical protein CLROS_038330 [Clostridium felsineum]URZ13482.1 hypothetical protein CROST_042480 [Clostridium felsineum]URZ14546.1 hypothetical protein CLFE_005430 [Clostridium felsineum DSM 794]